MNGKVSRSPSAPVQRRTRLTVAPFEGFDRSAVLALPQEVIDDQLVSLTEGELKVLLAVVRATNGGQREQVALTVRTLCQGGVPDVLSGRGTGLSARTVQTAYTKLEHTGLLRVLRRSAVDGSGLPSLFSLPLLMPSLSGMQQGAAMRFPGYAARRVRLPLLVCDRLLVDLSGAELKVLLYVLRHTFCAGVQDEVMAMARLVENTGLSLRHTRIAVNNLTAKGYIVVQHRQDPERGKLPSRFGVRVIGEAAPFAAPDQPRGGAVRSHTTTVPPEPARPVWLVPEPAAALEPQKPAMQVLPPVAPEMAPTPARHEPLAGPSTPIVVAGSGAARPAHAHEVPEELLRDNNPIWAAVKRVLATRLPQHVFLPWIASTASIGSSGTELLVAVRDEHHRWFLESKLQDRVLAALIEAGYPDMTIRYLNYPGTVPPIQE